ncbi:MAG: FAD-dependent oxidoreductase [Spirochaeta sp.]|nr:FAD-dependent oxidoreductase [Spirochaeta sp.]
MSDRMQLLSLQQLLARMLEEYRAHASVFGLHKDIWYRKQDSRNISIMREQCDLPLGPAAGPHTQLAQNIVSAYLSGSRFIELKTVQILDALEIEKPCIDAADEAYNTEWSTELSLEKAWQEYAKAWIALHVVEELWDLGAEPGRRSFIFNMSVGYNLEGIKNERMQQFIDRMIAPGNEPLFQTWIRELETAMPVLLAGSGLEHKQDAVVAACRRAAAPMCSSVTLSTMHGCPPAEIESICRYMLTEKKLDTYVKLNPTLLGFDTVRTILDDLGYDYVELDTQGFAHDLTYEDACGILKRLQETARGVGRGFGVKLTNTLAVNNNRGRLPGEQMYLSGRALYPLAVNVAAKIAAEFKGELPISYCGGISVHNAAAVFKTGIRPLTLCTVLLKPGGYARQLQMARELESVAEWGTAGVAGATAAASHGGALIDVAALTHLAEQARTDRSSHKDFRGTDAVRVPGQLPVQDCYKAPCVSACPIGQHVPEYIRLVGDYEGCVNIRELKKIAVEAGGSEYRAGWKRPEPTRGLTCAVIGAGPAGLSAAYFLAREGCEVTVFEREASAGGVIRNVIPEFRLPVEAIEQDIEFIAEHGVEFVFGADRNLSAAGLREQGFGPILVAIGAEKENPLRLAGDRSRVVRSLDFLWDFRGNATKVEVGPRVVVVGGGNTAMDAARAATTLPGVEEVCVLYRRTEAQMPADREEYDNAVADGVKFSFLRNPEQLTEDGGLSVRVMELGEPDASGRRRPLATDTTESMGADTVIAAIGERVDSEMLKRFGIPLNEDDGVTTNPVTHATEQDGIYLIGDALTGPSTVVQCIAAARTAADAVLRTHDPDWKRTEKLPPANLQVRLPQITRRKIEMVAQPNPHSYTDPAAFAATEYSRCLECSYVCNKCVEVCPNRANIAVPTASEDLFQDPFQIVHIDAYCNECGNCAQFCPWEEGAPYLDKPTIFSSRAEFESSSNDGWLVEADGVTTRITEPSTAGPIPANPDRAAQFERLFALLNGDQPQLFSELEDMR